MQVVEPSVSRANRPQGTGFTLTVELMSLSALSAPALRGAAGGAVTPAADGVGGAGALSGGGTTGSGSERGGGAERAQAPWPSLGLAVQDPWTM
jgi:hypothetical protein